MYLPLQTRHKQAALTYLFMLCVAILSSCKKEEITAKVTAEPKLTASVGSVLLQREKATEEVLTLNWSAATISGSKGAITYFLQWDRKGSGFSNPANIKIGRDILKLVYTQGELNNMVVTLPSDVPTDIELRIVGATSDGSVTPFYSNVIELKVTPYPKNVPPPFNQLWIVGSAAPSGWNIDAPTPLLQDGNDPYLFTFTGKLTAGEFKVPTAKGDWGAAFYRPVENYPAATDKRIQLSAGDPDNKWQIKVDGNYKLTLNLRDMTMDIVNADPPVAPFNKLWLLGDATPGGWSLDNASPMTVNAGDPFVFTWEGKLVAGDFKIATEKNFDGAFYRPTTNAPALTETAIQLNAGDPDNKWHITTATAGNYKITLNLRNSTISIVNTDKPLYTKLWIIGDASPGGWSLDNATELVVNATDPFTFTYTGAFTAGEFKIATKLDFNGAFYRPTTNHPELTDPLVQLNAGEPDNKWQITSAGNYKLTLNIKNLTVNIVKQ